MQGIELVEIPTDDTGKVVAMIVHKDQVIVACEHAIFCLDLEQMKLVPIILEHADEIPPNID